MTFQKVDLYQPILNTRVGPPPMTIRVGVTVNQNYMESGVPQGTIKAETYVLLSCLPEEIRKRVELAIQMLIAGG